MRRLRPASIALGVAALATTVVGAKYINVHREHARMRAEWQSKVEAYRTQFGEGATRAQVEAALDGSRAVWQRFSGGVIEPGENLFQDSALVGTTPNLFCGTVTHAHAVFVYRTDAAVEVVTDRPNDLLHRIYLEEVDSCGVL